MSSNKMIVIFEISGFVGTSKRDKVEASIQAIADGWMRVTKDCWIITTESHITESDVAEKIALHLSNKDSLLVILVDVLASEGQLSKSSWEWIRGHLED